MEIETDTVDWGDLWAHTPTDGRGPHLLRSHLLGASDLAETFASRFGLGELARLLGLWHDVGKAHPGFQEYLVQSARGKDVASVPHAIWGAALGYGIRQADGPWREVVLPIAGHHAGLKSPDLLKNDVRETVETEPEVFERIQALAGELPMPSEIPAPPAEPLDRELRIRMLLSVLVDADRLDTEAHTCPEAAEHRGFDASMRDLWEDFAEDQQALMDGAHETTVNAVRKDVYEACIEAAEGTRGIYRLTVPTGGGKTRSGLAFALRHAIRHGLERVVVAIPYTSIIEQTADVYRDILGEEMVLEHHSRVRRRRDENQKPHHVRLRLATQNWDVPVVVTTTVQLFESLLSHRPSAVRKTHRVADSVVILDEVQTLPPGLLEPTADVLRGLVQDYGTTLVLCTATQPALHGTPYVHAFDDIGVDEIVPDHPEHFRALRRVRYHRLPEPISWDHLSDRLEDEQQVLAVLNTRRDAIAVLESLSSTEDVIHLSSLLCGAHRRDQLARAQARLTDEQAVRVVSTQVVESGVDIDFPVVYRALGPLDRIVQAAGRCNREGRRDHGEVFVFEPSEGGSPGGAYRTGLGHARQLLRNRDLERLHDPEIYERYFELLFRDQDLDANGVQPLRRDLRYREVSQRYRLIDQDTVPVVVDYEGRGHGLAERWYADPTRRGLASVQPYVVNLYRHEVEEYRRSGWAAPLGRETDLHLWEGDYHDLYGIREGVRDPTDLVIAR